MKKYFILLLFLVSCSKIQNVEQFPENPPSGVYIRIKSFDVDLEKFEIISDSVSLKYSRDELIGWKFKKIDSAFNDIHCQFIYNKYMYSKDTIILYPSNDLPDKLEWGYYNFVISGGQYSDTLEFYAQLKYQPII